MPKEWLFRFTKPPIPEGSGTITPAEAEQWLLKQLKARQRPEEDVLWDLAKFYSYTGRQPEAFARVKQLVNIAETAEKRAAYYLVMGQLMEQMRDFQTAIKYYRQALSLEPVNNQTWYFIHNNLGYCLNHFGRYTEAEPYCRRAVEIDPLQYNAYKNLGISFEGQGDYTSAATCYIKAVQMNASDPRALKHLERLAERHPTVTVDVPDFDAQLKACRLAVQKAAAVRDQILTQWKQKVVTIGPLPS